MTLQQHTRILGFAHLAYGTVLALFAGMLGIFLGRGNTIWDSNFALMFFLLAILYPLAFLATGYGVLFDKPWVKITAIVSVVLSITVFPVGTVLAAYTLWYCFGGGGQNFSF
jgi:uncharacterized membrane protein